MDKSVQPTKTVHAPAYAKTEWASHCPHPSALKLAISLIGIKQETLSWPKDFSPRMLRIYKLYFICNRKRLFFCSKAIKGQHRRSFSILISRYKRCYSFRIKTKKWRWAHHHFNYNALLKCINECIQIFFQTFSNILVIDVFGHLNDAFDLVL